MCEQTYLIHACIKADLEDIWPARPHYLSRGRLRDKYGHAGRGLICDVDMNGAELFSVDDRRAEGSLSKLGSLAVAGGETSHAPSRHI
jgi:hypothetical protein